MHTTPPSVAIAESYPTFWDDIVNLTVATDPLEDAYSTFMNSAEDEFPAESNPTAVPLHQE